MATGPSSQQQVADSSLHVDVDVPLESQEDRVSTCKLLSRLGSVGLPQFPSQLITFVLWCIPLILVGQLKNTNMLAALGLCNVMNNMLGFSWIWGLTSAVNTLSSQDWGAGSYHSIGITLQRALLIDIFFAVIPLTLVWLNSIRILESIGQPSEVVEYVGIYTRIRIPGLLCEAISVCMNRTLASIGNTRINLATSLTQAVANITFNSILIPWLHFEGAAIAITLCDVTGALMNCTLAFRNADFKRCWPGFTRQAFRGWLPYLQLSVPSFLLLATEMWAWTGQDFLAGLISAPALAANAIAPQIALLQYAIGSSISVAATTTIGNSLGEGNANQARRAARLSVLLVPLCLTPTTITILALRHIVPRAFTQDEVVAQMVTDLLVVVQIFCIFDGHQAALTGILIGVGKQAIAAPLIVICYWIIGIPIGVVLAFGFFGIQPLGIRGLWGGMTIAVILHVFSFGFVVCRLDWKRAVIEVRKRQSAEKDDNALQRELVQTDFLAAQ